MDGTHVLVGRELVEGSRQLSVLAVNAGFMILTGAIVGFRTWIKIDIVKTLGIDDILAVAATIVAYGLSAACMAAAYYGTGKHVWQIESEVLIPYGKSIYSTRLLYVLGLLVIKLSILLLYLRLDPRRIFRISAYILIFIVVGLSVPSFFVLAFSCMPPSMFWDSSVKGHCIDPKQQQIFYDSNGILNIVTDLLIYIFPLPMLWGVHIPKSQKLALLGLFSVGFVAVAAGCVRFVYVRRLAKTTDNSYELADALNWCTIELYTAIICSSIPSFKPFVKRYMPHLLSSTKSLGYSNPRRRDYPLRSLSGRIDNSINPTPMKTTITGKGADAIENSSEEAIIPSGCGIMTKKEVRVDVESHGIERYRPDISLDGVERQFSSDNY